MLQSPSTNVSVVRKNYVKTSCFHLNTSPVSRFLSLLVARRKTFLKIVLSVHSFSTWILNYLETLEAFLFHCAENWLFYLRLNFKRNDKSSSTIFTKCEISLSIFDGTFSINLFTKRFNFCISSKPTNLLKIVFFSLFCLSLFIIIRMSPASNTKCGSFYIK